MSDGIEATITETGAIRPVASVVVEPDPVAIEVGETQTFTACVFAANGEELTDRAIAWSSNNTGVATVNATSGVATGVAPSGATAALITATVTTGAPIGAPVVHHGHRAVVPVPGPAIFPAC